MHKHTLTERILGVLVFLIGIVLLGLVFKMAHSMFISQSSGIQIIAAKTGATATTQLGESAVKLFAKIGLLFLMTIVSSIIASKGISLYFAALSQKTKVSIEDVEKE